MLSNSDAQDERLTTPDYAGTGLPWAVDSGHVLESLAVDPRSGLPGARVAELRALHGPNQLRARAPRRLAAILADQFRSIVVVLLAVAGALAIAFGEVVEGLAIFAVILINGTIGFVTEWRATRSMEALSRLGQVGTVVIRDGHSRRIDADQLVPGDIVVLEGGDVVTADLRLIEAARLQADESALTGESLPVTKHADSVGADARIMERANMAFKGTSLTRGSGLGVVVGTGRNTELGRISSLVSVAESQRTPLEERLDALGRRLAWAVVLLALAIAGAGIATGRELFLAIEVAIALAVAAIPEGLPIVATIALARGMWRMARRNAVIERLSAVETLGATSVILTDKTGTLTENRMAVAGAWIGGLEFSHQGSGLVPHKPPADAASADTLLDRALEVAALCANASVIRSGDEFEAVGDPTEVALLSAALERGIERPRLIERYPETAEVPFDPQSKLMATVHQSGDTALFAIKGAPEAVVPRAVAVRTGSGDEPLETASRQAWLDRARALGERGLRTIAVAMKSGCDGREEPYTDLVLLGIFGLEDPPRAGIGEAMQRCRDAGVMVVMVTGDHAATACSVAGRIGLSRGASGSPRCVDGSELDAWLATSDDQGLQQPLVFSRVSPEQKLDLIARFQEAGNVVAMTGDGVNDAPALKKADIGVAMGIRGTAVAREAAGMVLRDDEFGTIAEAIAQGRAIYENIRKFAVYLLSCNISEVLVVTLATVAGAPLPLLPLQILFLNLVTDVFPALALGVGEGSTKLMKRPPRPADEPLLTRHHWFRIVVHGVVISATVLAAMAIARFQLGFDAPRAVAVSFCTLAFAQLWHVLNMRDEARRVFDNEITRNPWVWAAVALCSTLILVAVYAPPVSGVLELTHPGLSGWAVILSMSFVPLLLAPVVRRVAQLASTRS